MTTQAIFAFLISLILTTILLQNSQKLAGKFGLMDVPGGRKRHTQPTPLMGGLTIILIICPIMLAYSLIYKDYFYHMVVATSAVALLIAILAIVDDRLHIAPIIRLLLSSLFFGAAMWFEPGLQIGAISWNGGEGYISLRGYTIFGTVLCLIALINAMNMADGKNGLVTGLFFGFAILLFIGARPSFSPIIAILAGSTAVLFVYNLRGRVFLGDGGSYGFAALIGLLAIYVYQRSDVLVSADQVGLMFMVPVGDMGRLMINRIRRGTSPFEPDRDHLHHMLQAKLGWHKGLLLYWLMVLPPAALSLLLPQFTLHIIAAVFVVYVLVVYISVRKSEMA